MINKKEILKNKYFHLQKQIKLTIMCTVTNDDGTFLVLNRKKKDWPGLTFPGGHVEDNETITDAVIREMKEETGLEVSLLENKGYIEWNELGDGVRHLAILFIAKKYQGKLVSSKEGEVFFIKEKDISKYPLSNDFEAIYHQLFNL